MYVTSYICGGLNLVYLVGEYDWGDCSYEFLKIMGEEKRKTK